MTVTKGAGLQLPRFTWFCPTPSLEDPKVGMSWRKESNYQSGPCRGEGAVCMKSTQLTAPAGSDLRFCLNKQAPACFIVLSVARGR